MEDRFPPSPTDTESRDFKNPTTITMCLHFSNHMYTKQIQSEVEGTFKADDYRTRSSKGSLDSEFP